VWIEKYHVGAQGEEWALSLLERCLIAGRALWFYAGKIIWPQNLTFIYPRWQIDPGVWWQHLFPLAAVATILTLWLLRERITRGPLAAVLFFAITLVPALGFFDVFPMRFSYVADHFQYLASIGLIALTVAWSTDLAGRLGTRYKRLGFSLCLAVLLVLGLGVYHQGKIYQDLETLWLDTIQKNPDGWMPHNNLGMILAGRGRLDEAIAHYSRAIQIKPDAEKTHSNLADVLVRQGRLEPALRHYYKAAQIKPNSWQTHNNIGSLLYRLEKLDTAMAHYVRALKIKPDSAVVHHNIAELLTRQGKLEEAIAHNLAALEIKPDFTVVLNNLAWIFATHRNPKFRHAEQAVELAERACQYTDYANPGILDTLAAAYAQANRFAEAAETAQKAVEVAVDSGQMALAQDIETRLLLYRAGKPYYET
jgi:tetratricopeptide (TPR) repeat protein